MSYVAINSNKDKFYYDDDCCNNDYYRVIWRNGEEKWYSHHNNLNILHRLDGPSLICPNGYKEWYYEGKYIPVDSQKDFEKYLKLLAFI